MVAAMSPHLSAQSARPAQSPCQGGVTDRSGTRLWGLQLVVGLLCAAVCHAVMALAMLGIVTASASPSPPRGIGPAEFFSHPFAALASSLLAAAAALGLYRALMRRLRRGQVPEISAPGALKELGAGLALGAGLMILCFSILVALGAYRVQAVSWHPAILGSLAMGVVAGVGEELLVRATLLRLICALAGPWWALATTSLFFGLAHLANSGATALGAVAIVLEAGLVLGGAYLLTGRAWLAIGIHIAWNAVQGGVFGSAISGISGARGMIQATWSGPDLVTGGSMGMEGSLVTVVVGLVAGTVLLAMARRRGRV